MLTAPRGRSTGRGLVALAVGSMVLTGPVGLALAQNAVDPATEAGLSGTLPRPPAADPFDIPTDFPDVAPPETAEDVAAADLTDTPAGGGEAPLPNPSLTFEVSTGVRNDGDNTFSSTGLGLTYLTRTRTQSLELSLGTDITVGADENRTFFPDVNLAYSRDTGVLLLGLTGSFQIREVDGNDGDLVFDTSDLVVDNDGTVTTTNLGLSADIARRAPIGLELNGSYRLREFQDVNDPALNDVETLTLGGAVRLTMSPTLAFRLTGTQTTTDGGGARNTEETRDAYGVRVSWQASPILAVDAGLSQSQSSTDRDQIIPVLDGAGNVIGLVSTGARETIEQRGLVGDVALTWDRPNGTIGLTAEREQTVNGDIDRIGLSRELALAGGGDLRLGLGLTNFDGSDAAVTGNIAYSQPLPGDQRFTATLARTANVDGNDQNVVRTRGELGYSRPLTALSEISFTAGLSRIDVLEGPEDDRSSTTAGVNYTHQITRDWGLNAGYRGTFNRSGAGDDDQNLFLNISRTFTFRP